MCYFPLGGEAAVSSETNVILWRSLKKNGPKFSA